MPATVRAGCREPAPQPPPTCQPPRRPATPPSSDNLRGFFEQCFPTLLKRLFGYDGTSWLTLVARVRRRCLPAAAGRVRPCQPPACSPPTSRRSPLRPPGRPPPPQSPKEADARALLRLLSPAGPLFAAVCAADADGATQFFFPRERLPTHTQVGGAWGFGGAWLRMVAHVRVSGSLVRSLRPADCPRPAPRPATLAQMLLASPAGRAELERWPQYGRGAIVADASGRCHVKVRAHAWLACLPARGVLSCPRRQHEAAPAPACWRRQARAPWPALLPTSVPPAAAPNHPCPPAAGRLPVLPLLVCLLCDQGRPGRRLRARRRRRRRPVAARPGRRRADVVCAQGAAGAGSQAAACCGLAAAATASHIARLLLSLPPAQTSDPPGPSLTLTCYHATHSRNRRRTRCT